MNDLAPVAPARVFVGVQIAPEIARELARVAATIEQPSVRLVAAADIHLTLVPPWPEIDCAGAIEQLRDAVRTFDPFALTLQHVGYGPHPRRPHLLWVDCVPTAELSALRAALLQYFGQEDPRPFRPHITLARMRGNGSVFARRHPLDLDVSFVQRVGALELFQSPEPPARGYRVLASAQFPRVPQAELAGQSRPSSNSSQE
ncbi:MAG TPA: RNA 2',3'-cyclic phosphodiesterase [Xanthobacteraceae bacterium]|nr:RNA 2',3'-cyclic phosphodiesterase [Xanthobacteraceae bacterium]